MIKLLIIADDFTGGLDTGVQFAQKGIPTQVVTNPAVDYEDAAQGCEVLVVVAETRHMPARQAYDTVHAIVKKSVGMGIPHIYKKTDSALRGNIGAELNAALDASGAEALAFLPAMPGIGRTTVDGVHLIDGVPVAESVFGKDPFEPVRESNVARLLMLQSDAPAFNAVPERIPREKGILIIDARSDEDLKTAGQALAARDGLQVTAGCAGFAAALPELLGLKRGEAPKTPPLDPGLFVLCGSVNPITQRQLSFAEANGFTRLHILPQQKLEEHYFDSPAGQVSLREWHREALKTPWLILDANDADDENAQTLAYASDRNMGREEIRRRISGALGRILSQLLSSPSARTLLITGGDTLLQCMNHIQVFQMEPLLEVYPGVVLSQFDAGGQSRYVITKSGGFGEKTLLCDLKALIQRQQGQI